MKRTNVIILLVFLTFVFTCISPYNTVVLYPSRLPLFAYKENTLCFQKDRLIYSGNVLHASPLSARAVEELNLGGSVQSLALVFLCYEGIPWASLWRRWLDAVETDMKIITYLHSKHTPMGTKAQGESDVKATRIPTATTKYMYLAGAMQACVSFILNSAEGCQIDGCYFVSETCVPISTPTRFLRSLPKGVSVLNFDDDSFLSASQWMFLSEGFMKYIALEFENPFPLHGIQVRGKMYQWGSECQEEAIFSAIARGMQMPVLHRVITHTTFELSAMPDKYQHILNPRHWPTEFVKIDPEMITDLHATGYVHFVRKILFNEVNMRTLTRHFDKHFPVRLVSLST